MLSSYRGRGEKLERIAAPVRPARFGSENGCLLGLGKVLRLTRQFLPKFQICQRAGSCPPIGGPKLLDGSGYMIVDRRRRKFEQPPNFLRSETPRDQSQAILLPVGQALYALLIHCHHPHTVTALMR